MVCEDGGTGGLPFRQEWDQARLALILTTTITMSFLPELEKRRTRVSTGVVSDGRLETIAQCHPFSQQESKTSSLVIALDAGLTFNDLSG